VPNKEALRRTLKEKHPGLDPESKEGREAMLQMIQAECDSYKKGGSHEGMFPEKWLPAAIAVLHEAFTEQNGMVNSTSKIVRGKVEKFYADRIEYAYTLEGKELMNEKNMAAL
jgi:long-chain acyl-CoA synthetase